MNINHMIDAVTHPNPYPFYAELMAQRPFYYDDRLKAWVVSSAEGITEILSHPACRVRPPDEPVPRGLVGSTAGVIFQYLARMNDGHKHQGLKQGITNRLAQMDISRLTTISQKWAQKRWHRAAELNEFIFEVPVSVMADFLGSPSDCLPDTVQWVRQFARCLNPLSSPEQVALGKTAADHLWTMLQPEHGDIWAANLIGLMFQAYEAIAGLIGNTLLALKKYDIAIALLPDFIQEVIRHDPSVQNTRRHLSEDTVIAGQRMRAGDMVLLILAAANRDPQLNPNPHQFDIERPNRQYFTFGLGAHACPGAVVAGVITQAVVEQCLRMGVVQKLHVVGYHAYGNLRIPIFQE